MSDAWGLEVLVNLIFLAATGAIAWHGITYRNEDGEKDFVRLLFGCIALVFFIAVLLRDVLERLSSVLNRKGFPRGRICDSP